MATNVTDLKLPGLKVYEPPNPNAPKQMDGTSTKDLQNNFLKLLTVQLQNQDPLNPMESAEMTSQLAQLNMVDGINTMNKSINSLLTMMQAADFMNFSSTVGRSALIAGNEMTFDGANPVALGIQFPESVTKTKVQITDASGNIVRAVDLGASTAGLENLYWDGLADDGSALAPGRYRLRVTGEREGVEVGAQTFVSSFVAAVGRNGDQISLTLADGKKISPTDVVQWVAQ